MSKNQNNVAVVQNSKVAELLKLLSAEKGGLRLAKQAIREEEQAAREASKLAKLEAEKAEETEKAKLAQVITQVKRILADAGITGRVFIDMRSGKFRIRKFRDSNQSKNASRSGK